MKNFVFNPKEEKFAVFVKKMLKGTFVYISGAIGRLSPDSVKLETSKHYWHTGTQGFDRGQGSINKYGLYYSKMG
ncbi:MAG: hypothetical protein R2861_16775 [Desulfobacterales bacterium]